MKLSVPGLTAAAAVLWAAAMLLVGLANLIWPSYGEAFLQVVASVYPGYDFKHTPGGVLILTCYALLDGAIGGALLAVLYNVFSCSTPRAA